MGLSSTSVQKAYEIFNEIKANFLPELRVTTWPSDMSEWSDLKQENPPLNEVIGWDRKDGGRWENICFFTKDPDKALIERFKELAERSISNSIICGPYKRNPEIWCIGWF